MSTYRLPIACHDSDRRWTLKWVIALAAVLAELVVACQELDGPVAPSLPLDPVAALAPGALPPPKAVTVSSESVVAQATVLLAAQVKGNTPMPEPCPGGAFICSGATIAGFGNAEYLFFVTSLQAVAEACIQPSGPSTAGAYTATTWFILDDGSTLMLDEVGMVCGPGASLVAPGGQHSFGNPVDGGGSWEVQDATGQFAGLTGAGTDAFHSVGAHFTAAYIGTLTY